MSHGSARVTRRRLLQTTATGAAVAAAGLVDAPALLRAQGAAVKLGVLHPVSGALSYSGQQGRLGATIAIEEINAAGGIKALGGAKIDAVLGDAQSTPEGGNAEVEKMNSAGVAAIVGGYASSICLTASQTAARYDLPYLVDVGVGCGMVSSTVKPRSGSCALRSFASPDPNSESSCTIITVLAGLPAWSLMVTRLSSAVFAITPKPGPNRNVFLRPRVTMLSATPTSTT